MKRHYVIAGHIVQLLFCCLLTACSGNHNGSAKDAEAAGLPEAARGGVLAADVSKVKTGMSVEEVEAILGNGEDATAPKGQGLPLGMWTTVDGESKFLDCTYRKWRVGDKSFVIAFFDGRVSGMLDGAPAVVED